MLHFSSLDTASLTDFMYSQVPVTMSRFTSSPFHKPSPFQFPHALPSPPETQAESMTMAAAYPSATSVLHDHGINESVLGISSPDQGSRIRKSSIAYNTSSLRETKDRSAQRPVKPLVIVIPPPSLIPNYAQASAAISLGPPNRVLQGTIMPLLPSVRRLVASILDIRLTHMIADVCSVNGHRERV